MLVVNTKEIFLLNLHQNRVHFPAERNAFVLDHQHGRRDVTCKPAMQVYSFKAILHMFDVFPTISFCLKMVTANGRDHLELNISDSICCLVKVRFRLCSLMHCTCF